MQAAHSPWILALIIGAINLPFGYWRATCRKLSFAWFVAVHAPVIIAIALRLLLGIAFRWSTVPLYMLAFVGGQFLGGGIHRLRRTEA